MTDKNTQEQDRILARVRKMMALANDAGASEGERDNALRMAHATLAKHNLTIAMAEEAGANPEKRDRATAESRNQPWARSVAHAVGELMFCRYFFSSCNKAGKITHNFVGREGNVRTAADMSEYVIGSIMKEANREWKKQADPGPWWTSFCKGAADQVRVRCKELRAAAEMVDKPASSGTSLVLASFYKTEADANAKFLADKLGISLTTKAVRTKRAGDGYANGKSFGNGISLNRQVGGASAVRRLS